MSAMSTTSSVRWQQPQLYPRLDHVCIPSHQLTDVAPFVYNVLGGKNKEGGVNDIFVGCAWTVANNAKLESISPVPGADNSNFLKRFLNTHGSTVHHVTFYVDNIDTAKARAESYGYTVVGLNKDDPYWMECFLQPKQVSGNIVIQFAQNTPVPADVTPADTTWSINHIKFPEECNHTTDSNRPQVHMLGVRVQTSNEQHAVKQWQQMLNGKLTRVERHDSAGYKTHYYTFVHSAMYIAVDIYHNSSVNDSFVAVDVATPDNRPIDLKNKYCKATKAAFRQVPYPSQQHSSL